MNLTQEFKPIFKINVPIMGEVRCRTCTVEQFNDLSHFRNIRDVMESIIVGHIPNTLKVTELQFVKEYITAVNKYCEEHKETLVIPYDNGYTAMMREKKGDEYDEPLKFVIETQCDKIVCDYARISFIELGSVDIIDYRKLAADAYKFNAVSNRIDGVEYLNNCWCVMTGKSLHGETHKESVLKEF